MANISIFFVFLTFIHAIFSLEFSNNELLNSLPILDISPLLKASVDNFCEETKEFNSKIHEAAQKIGFFYIKNHHISSDLISNLESVAREFFSLPLEEKLEISMSKGGKAWRGYFPVGDEYTSGIPDSKEGLYFGTELTDEDPRPLHGPNQFPPNKLGDLMKNNVLEYMIKLKHIGKLLMNSIACNFQVRDKEFLDQFNSPTELFRIFGYPPHSIEQHDQRSFGVGQHTDYGYLTILYQDQSGGLQVKNPLVEDEWLEVPPIPDTFVVNLGDALEYFTRGLYRATLHRVKQRRNESNLRISMPYFFDPSYDSVMASIISEEDYINFINENKKLDGIQSKLSHNIEERNKLRWDNMDPQLFKGTYGQYLKRKISKVFPSLFEREIKSEL